MINKSFKFVLVLLLLLFTPWLQAQTPTVTVELGDVLEATPNTLITVPINVTNFNNVGSYDFNIYWDSNELELVKNPEPQYTTKALYNYTTKKLNGEDGDDYLRIVDGSVTPFSFEDGELILLTFYVKTGANGTGEVTIYDNQGADNVAPAGKENSTVQSVNGVNLLAGSYKSTLAFTQTTLLNPTVVFANAREDGSGNLLVDIYGKNVRNIIGLTLAVDFDEADVPNTTGSEVLLPTANLHSTIQGNGYWVRNVVHDGMTDFANEVPANKSRLMFEWVQPDVEETPDGLVEGALTLDDDAVNYAGVIATIVVNGLTVADLTRLDLTIAKLNRVNNAEVDGLINISTDITVYLQDYYNAVTDNMNGQTNIPTSYSYTDDNTGATANENTDVDFSGGNIVDWIYVELRQANSAEFAMDGTRKTGEEQYGNGEYKFIQGKLGLLTTAGTILGADGKQFNFQDIPEGDYYIYVKHDEHKEILSFGDDQDGLPETFTDANGADFNFTNAPGKAYGYDPSQSPVVLPQAEVETGVYAAYSYSAPTLTAFVAGDITNVGTTSLTASGTVEGATTDDDYTPLTARGFEYSTDGFVTVMGTVVASGTDLGGFSAEITGLTGNTTYQVRPYATNKLGTTYGASQAVTTTTQLSQLADLASADVTSLMYNALTIQGTVTHDGWDTVTEVGFVYNTTGTPTVADTKVMVTLPGTATPISFNGTLAPLTANTVYYVRSYAITNTGTSYSNTLMVTTPVNGATLAALTAADVLDLKYNQMTLQGTVTDAGNGTVTAAGFVLNTTGTPTLGGSTELNITITGTSLPLTFSGTVVSLEGSTMYYVRAYATNEAGTTYSNEITVTTPAGNLLVSLKAFLQGAYDADTDLMKTGLNPSLPLTSNTPYDAATYSYTDETVGAIPNANVVDWVLVVLRSDVNTVVAMQPAFILADGSIVDVDGVSAVAFGGIDVAADYFVQVIHRNHLSVISAAAVTNTGAAIAYDFTTAQGQAYTTGGDAMVEVETGVFGLVAGDSDRSGIVVAADKTSINANLNVTGYYDADIDFSGIVVAADKTLVNSNVNKQSFVPAK